MKTDAESYLKTGSNELRVLEYRTGKQSFGVNILKVNKIVNDLTDLIRVPEAHHAVCGVIRDMNRLVPVIDMARFLGLEHDESEKQKVIVTEFFGLLTGFLIDRVDWIHHFQWQDVIDAEKVFSNIDHRYVIGIVKPTEERMVLLLDYETILLDLCPHLRSGQSFQYSGDTDFSGKRVLVAEDSPAVRSMLVNEMSDLGFEVVDACDGTEAWAAFEKKPFDLVISDVEMPQMDGLALTMRIRQSERPDTPVIVYSSIGDVGMKARAKFLKADAHVTKLNLDKLITAADKLIRGEKIEPAEETEEAPASELETIPVD
ncbi:response regulator [candidate division GN15 bacterium]|nr:response regulator [candidate division GN15 bacterium]